MVADFDAELVHVELKYISETIATGILHFSRPRRSLEILVVVKGLGHFVGTHWVPRAVQDVPDES